MKNSEIAMNFEWKSCVVFVGIIIMVYLFVYAHAAAQRSRIINMPSSFRFAYVILSWP